MAWETWSFDIFSSYSHLKCVDPRNKLHGLLGLYEERPIVIDYNKSVNQVYADLVSAVYAFVVETPEGPLEKVGSVQPW
jgi:hypothetical protein